MGRRVETLNSTSNATNAGHASLTVSNLSRHTHRNVHESLEEAISQDSDGLQGHEQSTNETVLASTEGQTSSGCDCTDECRSPECACAASGRLCSQNCTSLYVHHRSCYNAPYVMNNAGLEAYYLGSQVKFHSCFKTRLRAVASGQLSMEKMEDMSFRLSCGLFSGRELSLINELPVGGLEDQLGLRRGIPDDVRTPVGYPHIQWLFRLALSDRYDNGHCWKFSFCEGKWIDFAD
jgi:hypothetical protein